MPNKIATAEDVQVELRTLLAMTEEEAPSRARLASAIGDLAIKMSSNASLASMVGTALTEWAEAVGNAILTNSKGLDGFRVMNEWKTITILITGARGNKQQIIFGYELNSVEQLVVVIGNIEGHKISGLQFKVNTFDEPRDVARKYIRALEGYMDENSL
jgi:hypothetical protein